MTAAGAPPPPTGPQDPLAEAARRAAERARRGAETPEPSLGSRLGQIGVVGWMIVAPMLLGLLAGRWLDRLAGGGITVTAALIMLGAGVGFWSAWKWMNRS
ncbi:AtpZ/AtpI family protein (plasmid) [Paroceanicella profunda]|uniref:AtpZ/AtpI family protein n=1 Tax=Paroceanicella profunda TaxID=2579971 RepID=A0A5B8G3M0_9RHOB|nr:AtpZ/AtpI family protein [Paroceanicella profunda]QDL93989.1 AtpZ/AtpI family protein [Paroceanicella profunda]